VYRIFVILTLFIFLSACSAKYRHSDDYLAGDFVHSKKNKNIMDSKEILLTSLFVATSHIPEEIKITVEFIERGKNSLSKEARNKIADFAKEVISYEDYSVIVEECEDNPEADYNKLSEKRSENVKRALIKNGVDKDKIEIKQKSASKEKTEEGRLGQNRKVVIKAELW